MKPRLTPEEDAALHAELMQEKDKVYAVLDKMLWHFNKVSVLGQKLAACELMHYFICVNTPNEKEALALLENINEQIAIGIKTRFSMAGDVPTTTQ